MIVLALFVLGLIFGSFINVLVIRRGARSLGGRSECFSCGADIRWYDNVPLVSYLVLKGRCRTCSSRISLQYPLVEGATGALFAGIGSAYVSSATSLDPAIVLDGLLALAIGGLFVAIAAYDMRHTIIPDGWAYLSGLLALVLALLERGAGEGVLITLSAGPIAALPLLALWAVSGGRWMGLGDAKLALSIGWILGAYTGLVAVFFAFILGAALSLPLIALSSAGWKTFVSRFTPTRLSEKLVLGFTMKSEVPFGPFLIVSTVALWIMQLYRIALPFSL